MRFLADENFPFPALVALRDGGYEVSSIAEDHAGSPDELVAATCDNEERILLTFDKDFGDLVYAGDCQLAHPLSCFALCRSRSWW